VSPPRTGRRQQNGRPTSVPGGENDPRRGGAALEGVHVEVLFLSGIDGFCHRYEVLHRAAQLRTCGIASTIRAFTDPRTLRDSERADALFVYRSPLTALVREVIARVRRAGRLVLGSVDDLVFRREPDALPPGRPWEPGEEALWLEGVARYRATLDLCDAFVAPTEPLLEEARALGWPAFLHRDAASEVELALADRARGRRARSAARAARVVLGYFSGTATHDADFLEATPALVEILRERPEVELLVVGPLELDPSLAAFGVRIRRLPLLGWTEIPERMVEVDVALAPLAWRSRFAFAKGEVKYIEAASAGVPTIASPTPAFLHAVRDGQTGRIARDHHGWIGALRELVDSPAARAAMGRAAYADVRARFSPEARGPELVGILARALPARVSVAATLAATAPGAEGVWPQGPWRHGERPAHAALEPDAVPDLHLPGGGDVSPPLAAGSLLEQEFTASRDALVRLDLGTVTFGQNLDHRLTVWLTDDCGRIVSVWRMEGADAPDRSWLAFELDRPMRSPGRRYRLTLRSAGTAAGNAVSFELAHTAPSPGTPAARLDGRPLRAPLALRTFAAWPAAVRRPSRALTPVGSEARPPPSPSP
jgi:Glycosyl transferases group 1